MENKEEVMEKLNEALYKTASEFIQKYDLHISEILIYPDNTLIKEYRDIGNNIVYDLNNIQYFVKESNNG